MTYSILARDAKADQIGLSMTTMTAACGSIMKFYAETAETVFACQAFSEYGSGHRFADFLDSGGSLAQYTKELEGGDEFLGYKQIAMITRNGTIEAFTGDDCTDWAGHIIGDDYVAFGNVLDGKHVVEAMASEFETSQGKDLAERLLLATEAGQKAGGQAVRGRSLPELSTMLRVHDYKADPYVFAQGKAPTFDLRVDLEVDPVAKLRRMYKPMCALMADYKMRYGLNPAEYLDSTPVVPELEMHANQF